MVFLLGKRQTAPGLCEQGLGFARFPPGKQVLSPGPRSRRADSCGPASVWDTGFIKPLLGRWTRLEGSQCQRQAVVYFLDLSASGPGWKPTEPSSRSRATSTGQHHHVVHNVLSIASCHRRPFSIPGCLALSGETAPDQVVGVQGGGQRGQELGTADSIAPSESPHAVRWPTGLFTSVLGIARSRIPELGRHLNGLQLGVERQLV